MAGDPRDLNADESSASHPEFQEQVLASDDIPHPEPPEPEDAPPAADAAPSGDSLSKNVMISMVANALYLVTRIFIPPISLVFISLETLGIWGMCFMLIGYFGMGAFGISNAYIRFVGVFFKRDDITSINRLISTGLAITCTGAAVSLVGLWFGMPYLIRELEVAPELHETAFILFFGTMAVFMLDLTFGAFQYVLTGLNRLVAERSVYIASFMLEWVLVIALFLLDFGVYALLYAFAARYIFTTVTYAWLTYRALPGFRIGFGYIDRSFVNYFVRFGGIVQLTGLLSMFLGSVQRLIAGLQLHVETVALFDLGEKFPRMATAIPAAINHALFPAATHLEQGGDPSDLSRLYLDGSRYTSLITGIIMGFMVWFSFAVMAAWVGNDPKFELAVLLMSLFPLPVHLHTLTGPAGSMFKGIGQPQRELLFPLIHAVVLAVMLPAAFYLESGWSAVTLAIVVSGSQLLASIIYLVYANLRFHISQWQHFKEAMIPGLVPYLIGGLVFLPFRPLMAPYLDNRWITLGLLIPAGISYCLLSGFASWFFFNEEERGRIRSMSAKLTGRFSRRS
ncbi:hypothetical protein SCOR_02810 [Sulfidibacter corallicola]|uniref:Membrane protein involved in the export of O-antigen and teichoic acid n=1 Tax=Sulfidibacter corallicola TaxID=2818388 RepID=A0A8A4TG58_SULCO|nr:hypothetical protein [Sulfidibacter corallicola]QTD48540.1 hypothetical protein J3U87_23415 [Sulfidibacter corallicola]